MFLCVTASTVSSLKQIVLKANSGRELDPQKGTFLDRIVGVVFLATSHDGSFLANLARAFGGVVTDVMRDLVANSSKLGELSDNYRDYLVAKGRRINHLIYYEKESVGGIPVVSTGSANPGLLA